MNTSKQNQNIRKNTSLLTFFKSKQPSATEDLVVSNEVASDYAVRKQKYSLYSLVWGRSEFGWCPAIIEKDSNTALYYREGSNSIEEWHLRFLTEPASRSWRYEEDIQLFQLDKFPHLLETDKFRGSTKSALNKAEELFHLPPDERADSLTDDACINLSQSESEDEVIKTVRKDVSNYIQNRPSKRKSKLSFQSKQKRMRVLESDSDIEYLPSEESIVNETETESSDDAMEIMDNSPSQSRFFSKKLQSKTLNTSTNHNASSPTSTPIPNRFCTSAGVGLSPSITPNAQSSLAKFQCSFNISQNSEVSTLKCESLADSIMNITQNIEYMHEKQTWLQSTKIKDKEGRKPTDPDYNPKSLYVPPEFIAMKTPAQKQWWEIKSQNFDTILIFKVGKFYELYHMDAVIAVRELGLSFMKGEIAHCGFPEVAFARFAETLVDRGFKIARVEQTETPKQMEQRNKTQGHSSKVVRREVCSIESKGTKNYSSLSGELLPMDTTQYLYAITCRELNHNEVEVGFCFIDTQIGTFHIGQFINDRHLSSLRTLLSHYPPAQLLYEKNRLPQSVLFLLQLYPGVVFDPLIPGKEFWDVSNTLKYLTESKYLGSSCHEWPTPIKSLLSPNSSLGLSARSEGEMAVSCLGAVIWCLVRCKLEKNILSLKRIEIHNPHDSKTAGSIGKNNSLKYLVLDATALHNLDVIDASGDTSKTKGTLLYTIDQCASGMGKRLLRQWICNPLTNPKDIIKRQEAIQELIRLKPEMNQLKKILKSIPDLERLLRKIHTFGVHKPNDDHPDCRAVLYEETIYNKRKIHDFVNCLNGLRSSLEITELFLPILPELNSLLLLKLLTSEIDCNDSTIVNINTLSLDESGNENNIAPTDSTQSLKELIEYFDNSFVAEEARKSGKILPLPGVDIEYDRAKEDIKEVEKSLENYLSEQKKRIGNSKIKYWYGGKMRYQIEISEDFLKKTRQPDDYTLVSQKKGIRRFMTPTVKRLLEDMTRVEERRDKAIKGTMVNLFRSFDQHFTRWEKVVSNIATIDALCSLAIFSGASDGPMCIPEFLPNTQKPTLRILDGRHPTLCRVVESGNFIPNDIILGGAEETSSHCMIITGPNMGGKSTLIRQAGAIVILAQMGCYVPAKSCQLTPLTRIFSRLGASDRILAGESTFFVELSETASILRNADSHSLVLLDEFGRGTATFDGTAIASSVLDTLVSKVKCLTLFSTHYHSILDEARGWAGVQLGHMQCLVSEDDDKESESIIFLYKLAEGSCPKSYGFNVAKLAGINSEIISLAKKKADEMNRTAERLKALRKLARISQDIDPVES